ncbi:MAG: hypothetical protein H0V63_10345 [Burkholderiaceae bacterium]|nr:hypothetical protein [Burkholderiaceae bacterium]
MPQTGAGLALIAKYGVPFGAAMLGAAIIAALDPPKTRKELFMQAMVAGIGSTVFGAAALRVAVYFLAGYGLDLESLTIPVYFLTGALSWGFFGAIVKLRSLLREKAAQKVIDRL